MRPFRPALLGLLLLVLAGCGSYPAQITAPGGADGDPGSIAIRDARFTANPPRAGDEAYSAGSDAELTFTAVNTGEATDRLLDVTSPVAGGVDIAGDAQILGGFTLVSGAVGSAPRGAAVSSTVRLTELRQPLRAGLTYPVTFVFERAGSITLELPVGNPDALPPRADGT